MEPIASRPHMPGYQMEAVADGLLPWSWAEERFGSSHNYWVSTVRSDGRPSASAVWGLWLDGRFWFSCASNSRKALNLAQNAHCIVTTERADEAVIMEGLAQPVRGRELLARFVEAYKAKYDWVMDPDDDGYFIVTPRVVFGFIETADRFGKTATRWTFGM